MARNALQLAATAYSTGDAQLSNAALVLANRWPRDRRAITLAKGGGAFAVRLNTVPVTLNGRIITLTPVS